MPSVYILPVNEKNQKGEEEDVHTHAAHVHVCALLISQSSSNGEKEREIVSSSRFRTFISLFEKEIFPDNKRLHKCRPVSNPIISESSSRRDLYPDGFLEDGREAGHPSRLIE